MSKLYRRGNLVFADHFVVDVSQVAHMVRDDRCFERWAPGSLTTEKFGARITLILQPAPNFLINAAGPIENAVEISYDEQAEANADWGLLRAAMEERAAKASTAVKA